MTPHDAYAWLMQTPAPQGCDAFDRHVAGAILAVALSECGEGVSLAQTCGLGAVDLRLLAEWGFPRHVEALVARACDYVFTPDSEEQAVRDILMMYASGEGKLERPLAAMLARRCQRPNHLWQDLGLNDRGELSALMQRHFAGLARRNSGDMKWKKFLYRMICGAEGFQLCTTPICTECRDFEACFGDESGESLLARVRLSEQISVAAE